MVQSAKRNYLIAGATLMLLAVVAGAFGSHALKARLEPGIMDAYSIAVRYQVYHALAFLVLSILPQARKWVFVLMLSGTICFSGSIYLLSLDVLMGADFSFLGLVTPLGGTLLIFAWALLILNIVREKSGN